MHDLAGGGVGEAGAVVAGLGGRDAWAGRPGPGPAQGSGRHVRRGGGRGVPGGGGGDGRGASSGGEAPGGAPPILNVEVLAHHIMWATA
jgi:translation initiation factor IF-2